jgi:Protein of unknown function (DUF3987)
MMASTSNGNGNSTIDYRITDHLEVLTPVKRSKSKYHCPVCNGNDLDLNRTSGAYKCFSNECSSKDIRAAIDKLEGKPEWKPERDDWVKPIRPKAQTDYFYPDRDGNPLIKVVRSDDGEGNKNFPQFHWTGSHWKIGNPQEIRHRIPIYRLTEVRAAIGRGELIFWVEGENTADLLWKLGIAATTTLGGSDGYCRYGTYQADLAGARLVLTPDRDSNGLKYITNIKVDFANQIEGYYLAGTQGLWQNPAGGMDIGDDIRDLHLTKEQILTKVIAPGDYANIRSQQQSEQNGKTGSASRVDNVDNQSTTSQHRSANLLLSDINAIFERHLPIALRRAELAILAKKHGQNSLTVEGIFKELEANYAISANPTEIDKQLKAQRRTLQPHQVLPPSASYQSHELVRISQARGTNVEAALLCFLMACSGAGKNNHQLVINNYGDKLQVYANLFGLLIGDSGTLKSPTLKTFFVKPLQKLQADFKQIYNSELRQYQADLKAWESAPEDARGDEPHQPNLTRVLIEDCTPEKVDDIVLNQPHFSPIRYRDEFIGMINTLDKYGKGSGDSIQKGLSEFDGRKVNSDRMSTGTKTSDHDYHPVWFGGIQHTVFKQELAQKNGNEDGDGFLSRFFYVFITRTFKSWDTSSTIENEGQDVFAEAVKKINDLPSMTCYLEDESQRAWAKVADHYNWECINNHELSPWLKQCYSKAIGQLGKLILTLHLLDCALTDRPTGIIQADTVRRAALALDYFISQSISLIASNEETLESHLVKVLEKARRHGSMNTRQVCQMFSGKKRVDTPTAKNYLEQLVQSGYGVWGDKGIFIPNPETSSGSRVDNVDKC